MKKTKKLWVVLLALALVLMLGVCAAAEGTDDGWEPIPTSSAGLHKGDLYLQFDDDWAQGVTQPGAGYAGLHTSECMAAGTWFVNMERMMIKGTYTALAAYTTSGEDETVVVDPSVSEMQCAYMFYFAIREAETEWLPVSFTQEGLQPGDWYVDTDAMLDAYVEFTRNELNSEDDDPSNDLTLEQVRTLVLQEMENAGAATVLELGDYESISINPGGRYFEFKIGQKQIDKETNASVTEYTFWPLFAARNGVMEGYTVLKAGVKQVPTVVDSGDCGTEGNNAHYTLYSDGSMIIEGEGVLDEFASQVSYQYADLIKTVTIGEGITGCHIYTFNHCLNLEHVTLPKTFRMGCADGFYYCPSLKHICVDPESPYLTSDANGVVYSKDMTSIIKFPAGSDLTEYVIPDGVAVIEPEAFYCCEKLKKVTIPDSVTTIHVQAFCQDYALEGVKLPPRLTYLGARAFGLCASLKHIAIPKTLSKISYEMFEGCTSLSSVMIPYGITEIEREAFAHCDALADVYFDGSEAQWNRITIAEDENDALLGATFHFLPDGYNWTPLPVSPFGLNAGDCYLDLTSLPLAVLRHQGEAYSAEAAEAAGALAGSWYADHDARVVYGVCSYADADGVTQIKTVGPDAEAYHMVKQVEAHHWETVPKSTQALSKGDCYLNMQTLQSLINDEAVFAVLQTATFEIDYDNFAFRAVGEISGAPFVLFASAEPMLFYALEEYQAEWLPVHFYTEGLQAGDWYMDFDEEMAIMFEKGIYASDGSTDGPHIRAMYERVGNANIFFVNANQSSRLFRYKTGSASSFNYYPLMDLMGNNPTLNYAERFDRSIKQYYPEEYHWVTIPTSPEGLQKGECYLDFSFKIQNSRPESKDTILAMYNEGTWEIDYDKMVLRGSIDIPPEIYPKEQWYHMVYDPSPFLLQFALREAGTKWVALRYGEDGCSDGDWYLDLDAFVDAIGRDMGEKERDEVRDLLLRHVTFYYNEGGVRFVYRFDYTNLPVEDGPPISGSTTLPIGLELEDETAFPYDYAALHDCTKQYRKPADPEKPDEPEQEPEQESWLDKLLKPLKSAVSSILSFFRKLFKKNKR